MQNSSTNSEHKRSKIQRFSTLNDQIITLNSKDSVIVSCHLVQWPALISHCNQPLVLEVDSVQQQWADDVYLQMEHKLKNVTNTMCVKTVISAIKNLIVQLTQLKKLIAWQL